MISELCDTEDWSNYEECITTENSLIKKNNNNLNQINAALVR